MKLMEVATLDIWLRHSLAGCATASMTEKIAEATDQILLSIVFIIPYIAHRSLE